MVPPDWLETPWRVIEYAIGSDWRQPLIRRGSLSQFTPNQGHRAMIKQHKDSLVSSVCP